LQFVATPIRFLWCAGIER